MDLFSIGNGAIRPAGDSYRDKLSQGIYQDNGNDALNDFMKPTLGYCIEENQLVSTVNGKKPIKDISIGDEVYTKDGVSVVSEKHYTGLKPTVKIGTKCGNIVCTKNHKILTTKGWKEAGDISLDDCVAIRMDSINCNDNEYSLNDNIEFIPVNNISDFGECNVYDITVPDGHNFICQNIVVHNCVYQEGVIEFLHKFCGFTMGEADIVRRHFSKKTGTEEDIPIIKDGGYLTYGKGKKNEHYIKGFIQTMYDDYGVQKEDAEKIIGNFLQVIIDASDYLFSKNHADPYSWIGYICGYLRYYYPLEFITTALNIFEGKEEKSLAIINYAKKQGINISPIKFRHSIAQYSFDKETNQIFKGISSIKFMNAAIANEIYELRNNEYKNFIELVYDLRDKTSINSRQLKILVELDFFEEFGNANKLLTGLKMFELFDGKVNFRKSKMQEYGVPEELIRKYTEKETENTFMRVDSKGFMIEAFELIKAKRRTLEERIAAQMTHLGYIDITGNNYKGLAVVMDLNTKYSPKLHLYSLKNGTIVECKIKKQTFNRSKLLAGDIIEIRGQSREAKLKRTDNGDYEPIEGVTELWITDYRKVKGI